MPRTQPLWDLTDEQWARVLRGFVDELESASQAAHISAVNFDAAIRLIVDEKKSAFGELFVAAHGMLSAGAMISRFLWPSPQRRGSERGKKSIARGKALRRELGIADVSPLRIRRVRDSFEHLDERLDVLLPDVAVNGGVVFNEFLLDDESSIQVTAQQTAEVHFVRGYVGSRSALVLLGDELDLRTYMQEIAHLHEACQSWRESNVS